MRLPSSLPSLPPYLRKSNQALELPGGDGTRTLQPRFSTHVHVELLQDRGGGRGEAGVDVLKEGKEGGREGGTGE